jgi:hypothetical protein
MSEVLGGSHNEVTNAYPKGKDGKASHNYEAHHVIPFDSYKNTSTFQGSYGRGTTIRMDKEDHRFTESHGSNPDHKEFAAKQRNLIEQGKHREAWNNGVQDIRNACKKNGNPENTYDQHIKQAEEHFKKEEQRQQSSAKQQTSGQSKTSIQSSQKQVFSSNSNFMSPQKNTGKSR